MPKDENKKWMMRKGQFVQVSEQATSIPSGAQMLEPLEVRDFRKPSDEDPDTDMNNRTQGDFDGVQTGDLQDLLDNYQEDEENTSSRLTKPWYKHELGVHGVDFAPNASVDQLRKLFEDGLTSNWQPSDDDDSDLD